MYLLWIPLKDYSKLTEGNSNANNNLIRNSNANNSLELKLEGV